MNISRTFLFVYLLSIATIVSIFTIFFNANDINHESMIGKNYYYESYLEKEEILRKVITSHTTALKALQGNKLLYNYVTKGTNKTELEDLFLHTKKSFENITQIRYIDKNGYEKIRIDGDPISLYDDKASSKIVSQELLQYKGDQKYFKEFITLEPLEIGYSQITLNRDNGKITLPKEPTLRIAIGLFGGYKEIQGILIFNISLRDIFRDFKNSALYDISLVSQKGDFLTHYLPQYGLLGDDNNHTIKDEYPDDFSQILSSNEYIKEDFYTHKLFTNELNLEPITIILRLKNNSHDSWEIILKENFISIVILLSLIILPILDRLFNKKGQI